MKSPKAFTPEELTHASQIGKLLATTAATAGNSRDEARQTAAGWWARQLERLQAQFQQAER